MPLVPLEGILEVISKLEERSPRAARMLVTMGLYESMVDQAEALRPRLEPLLYAEIGKMSARARHDLVEASVAKAWETGELHGEELAADLDVIDEFVSKGLLGWALSQFNDKHPRDDQGRFTVKTGGSGKNPRTRGTASQRRAVSAVDDWVKQGLIDDNTRVGVRIQALDDKGKKHGNPENISVTPAELRQHVADSAQWDEFQQVSIPHGRAKVSRGNQAAFDIIGAVTGGHPAASGLANRIEGTHLGSADEMSRQWHQPSQGGQEQDRQAYRRLKMTGDVLRGVAAPGSAASVAGNIASLVGELGPEAEKVLGPGIRRAAYRYRGTERRPDGHLLNATKAARALAAQPDKAGRGPIGLITAHNSSEPTSGDDLTLRNVGDAATAYYLGFGGLPSQIPDREHAEISIQSGEVPPSRGVLIDADGDVISQAVGYNGDHYLPFDLRNLGDLRGGQYVRTRTMGGPTTEDLYTAVMTGTRQVQVASNSGVFTVQFDPNMRGMQRFSDKTHRMVKRYEQILSTIATSDKLYERDLTPQQQQEIRRQAAQGARNEREFRDLVRQGQDQMRAQESYASEEEEAATHHEAEQEAIASVKQDVASMPAGTYSNQWIKREIADRTQDILREKTGGGVKRLQLNGEGYYRALKALEQEFPYFIKRVDYESLPDWMSKRGLDNSQHKHARVRAADRGYVEPGQTNPEIGLVGENARRRVAPGRQQAETPRPETAAARPEAATGQQPGAPAAPAVPGAPKKEDYSTAALLKPGTPVYSTLERSLGTLVDHAASRASIEHGPYHGAPESVLADSGDAVQYVHYLANHQLADPNDAFGAGKKAIEWLKTAKPVERRRFFEGLRGYEELASGGYYSGKTGDQIVSLVDDAENALALAEPWAPVAKDEPAALSFQYDPMGDHSKPAPLTSLVPDAGVDIGSSDEEFARTRARLSGDPDISKALDAFEGAGENDMAEKTKELREEHQRNPGDKNALRALAAHHIAWSFLHAQDVTRKLRELMGGGDGPKVEKAHRRRVIVHKVDDSFSRRARQALGIPEPV